MVADVPEHVPAVLARELGVHPLAARVLVARGLTTPAAAAAFLEDGLGALPDPFTMKGMEAAVERICRALKDKQKITLWGDYDVDGVSSTALLSLFLDAVGADVATYIPHRLGEGYGLNREAVERIAKDGTRLLVTLDCGITSHAEIDVANAGGLDVVVVDHHAVPEVMPAAVAILNPLQPGCGYSTPHLCAGGVTFNLCMGLRKRLREEGAFAGRSEPNLKSMLDLVALATVADCVPLTGANRILVRHGLEVLSRGERPGIRALKEVAGLGPSSKVTAGLVGFRLGPRINAAGRLDDASLGLQLLRTTRESEAQTLAQALDVANSERQNIEAQMLTSALEQAAEMAATSKGFVLASDAWHAGVVGIVASRVVERFHRPTVLIALKDGVGKGSARSIDGFSMVDALKGCAEHLLRFGGHRAAAGVTVSQERLADFRSAFEQLAATQVKDEDMVARCRIDAVVSTQEWSEAAVEGLAVLGPFGMGNPEPVFMSRRSVATPRVLANKRAGAVGHLKLALESNPLLDVIGFGMADKVALTEGPMDLAYQVSVDEFRGVRRVQMRLKDLRTAVR